jgi:hypothetical protein
VVPPEGFPWPEKVSDVTVRSSTNDADDVAIDRGYAGRLLFFSSVHNVKFQGIRFLRGGWATEGDAGSLKTEGSLVPFPSTIPGLALEPLACVARLCLQMKMEAANQTDVHFVRCKFESSKNPQQGFAGRGSVISMMSGAPVFDSCEFRDNWGGAAGTLYIAGTAKPLFEDCLFENSGGAKGGWGGVMVPEGTSSGIWRRCTFRNNTGAPERLQWCSPLGCAAAGCVHPPPPPGHAPTPTAPLPPPHSSRNRATFRRVHTSGEEPFWQVPTELWSTMETLRLRFSKTVYLSATLVPRRVGLTTGSGARRRGSLVANSGRTLS